MYIVRDIFNLKFGHYKDVKALLEDATSKELLPDGKDMRALTDFTGNSYRLILEESYNTLADYEHSLQNGMGKTEWKSWYDKFKEHVESSHREILKQVM